MELWDLACSDNQFVAVAAPRGHAKSTAGTLAYGLAELLFRESKFCIIVSDTESQAAMFLGAMKSELMENESLIELFGIQRNEKNLVQFVKDTETDVIVRLTDGHQFRVMAKGAEQKLRGMLWDGKRPDLVLVDDLENDELVMNKDRRDKLKRWFRGALVPCLSPKGKLRMWGTVLHMDSVLEELMPKENSKTFRQSELKDWDISTRKTMWKSVKYRAHDEKLTEFLWPERFNKEFFQLKKEEAAINGMSDQYSQEFLNRPIDDSVAYFKRKDFVPMLDADYEKNMKWYCTVDLAISQENRADFSVFLVAGVDENKILHIRNVIRERLDGREIVDLLIALHRTYDFQMIGIEEMQVSKAIGPFLNETMIAEDCFIPLMKMKASGKDKMHRATSIQARMRARAVRFDTKADWYPTLQDELLKFPRGVKDDQVDTMAYLGLLLNNMVEAETKEELEEEEYQDELRNSGYFERGRSAVTGY